MIHLIISPKCQILLIMTFFYKKLLDVDTNWIWWCAYIKEDYKEYLVCFSVEYEHCVLELVFKQK